MSEIRFKPKQPAAVVPKEGNHKKGTTRVLPNWLSAYMAYTVESESPDAYHFWVGLTVMAAAIRRNVWINQKIYLLYPNLFTILVGPAGRTGKSTALRLGRTILHGVEGIFYGPDSVTREELIRQMAKAGGGPNAAQSAMVIISTELSSLIEPSGIKMIQFLTDIYDCEFNPKGWKYGTKQSGRDTIHNPVLNLLAGTTVSWIAEGLPAAATEHGFTSRTIFIYEDEPRYLKPFPGEADPELIKALINDLDHMSRIEGEFSWGPGARDTYVEVYGEIFANRPSDYRIEGFHNRKRVHVLKIAMLLSMAESDELVINKRDILTAMEILSNAEATMPKVFSALGKYDHASDMDRILQRIKETGGLSLMQIFADYRAVGDVETLGRIVSHLIQAGLVDREKRGERPNEETWLVPRG